MQKKKKEGCGADSERKFKRIGDPGDTFSFDWFFFRFVWYLMNSFGSSFVVACWVRLFPNRNVYSVEWGLMDIFRGKSNELLVKMNSI